jgi:predicted RNA-binding Zn ribbon-like protein
MNISDVPDPFPKLPALAQRLGVEPSDGDSTNTVVLRMQDGRCYDLFDLINAMLDRMDKAADYELHRTTGV